METSDFIKKAKEKALYKYRGKVLEVIKVTQGVVNCVMFKTHKINNKNEKVFTCFTCYGAMGEHFLANYKKNDRLKIRFRVKSTLIGTRYLTNCIVIEHERWRMNDDKLAKEERIEKINKSFEEKIKGKQTGLKFDTSWT